MKAVHLTSVHPRYDSRIFFKECVSLVNYGYNVSLIVADGKGDEVQFDVKIYDVGASKDRLDRMRYAPNRVLKKAIALNAEVYHLHDPELLPIGLKLKRIGKKVIFDAHEDTPKQILGKPYLSKPIKIVVSKVFEWYEAWACRQLDAVVAATPYIREKFLILGVKKVIDINNYPLLGELVLENIDWSKKVNQICYVGGLTKVRGITEIIQAIGLCKNGSCLQVAGVFSEKSFEEEICQLKDWQAVDYLGWVDRQGIKNILETSIAGLVTLHPIVNYLDALPVKMFEYMAAGLPVIASDIPLWKEIIDMHQCGICVNPFDPIAIAQAIDYLVQNPEVAKQMGSNGQNAVKEKYNWSIEERKLYSLYDQLI